MNKIIKLEWFLIIVGAITAFVLGTLGYWQLYQSAPNKTIFDCLYGAIRLFLLDLDQLTVQPPISLEIARWLAPLCFATATLKTLGALLYDRIREYAISRSRNHSIVIGSGDTTVRIIKSMLSISQAVVWIRLESDKNITHPINDPRLRILLVSSYNSGVMEDIGLYHAKHLLLDTGSDSTNLDLIDYVYKNQQQLNRLLKCSVQISNTALLPILSESTIFKTNFTSFEANLFNTNSFLARYIQNQYGPHQSGKLLDNKHNTCNLIVVAEPQLSASILIQLAKIAHFPDDKSLQITLIGTDAEDILSTIVKNVPALSSILNLKAFNVLPTFDYQNEINCFIDPLKNPLIQICTGNTEQIIQWVKCIERCPSKPETQIFPLSENAKRWVGNLYPSNRLNIKIIDILHEVFSIDSLFNESLDVLAKDIHERYLSQVRATSADRYNDAAVEWKILAESLKDANRAQADHLLIKQLILSKTYSIDTNQTALALTDEQKEELARIEHNRWMSDKLVNGWRYKKGVKDIANRYSPAIVRWELLPASEREKDIAAIEAIPELLQLIR
ncbi:MAG: hypothetical protein MI976_23835 [Pseudomonadales bacterium]|nr:hypothetical protein [Pseudomonadales bacterium]